MSNATVMGIDAGVKGAIAWWDGSVHVEDLPVLPDNTLDAAALVSRLMEIEPVLIVTELTFKPLSLVRMTGGIQACGRIVGAETCLVSPVRWKNRVIGSSANNKPLSIQVCQTLYPTAELIAPRCRVPSHDRAESVLQMEYARLLHEGRL